MRPRAKATSLHASRSYRVDRSLNMQNASLVLAFCFLGDGRVFDKVASVRPSSRAGPPPQSSAFSRRNSVKCGSGHL